MRKLSISAVIFSLGIFSLALIPGARADAYVYAGVLRLGSSGSSVASLQQALGIGADGVFGYGTRTAVVNFQLAHGLSPDGVVGPATAAAVSAIPASSSSASTQTQSSSVASSATYPAGCTAGTKYSSSTGLPCAGGANPLIPPGCKSNTDYSEYSATTGMPCATTPVYPAGCSSNYGFSTTTGRSCSLPVGCDSTDGYSPWSGLACDGSSALTYLPEGCTSKSGYSALTGASCATGQYAQALSGTSGSLRDVSLMTGYSGEYVPENLSNAYIAGYNITSDKGSDLSLTSAEIAITFSDGAASSNLGRYANSLGISFNGSQVGSADVSDFSKSGKTYTRRIELSGAFIAADSDTYLYITASTQKNISSSDSDNTWQVSLLELRYRDATGSTISDSRTGDIGEANTTSLHFRPVDNTDN